MITLYDREVLEARMAKLSAIIKSEHRLPKANRNPTVMADAARRIAKIKEWLDGSTDEQVQTKIVSKAEFRDGFRKEFNVPEPEEVMIINTIAELETAWPQIRGKNIQLKLREDRPELVTRLKELVKEHMKAMKSKGFR